MRLLSNNFLTQLMSMVKNVQPINSNITKNSTYNQHIHNQAFKEILKWKEFKKSIFVLAFHNLFVVPMQF